MFQNSWCEPVFSSPPVRSPQPKYRSPSPRALRTRSADPSPISSPGSSAEKVPCASENEIRSGSSCDVRGRLGRDERAVAPLAGGGPVVALDRLRAVLGGLAAGEQADAEQVRRERGDLDERGAGAQAHAVRRDRLELRPPDRCERHDARTVRSARDERRRHGLAPRMGRRRRGVRVDGRRVRDRLLLRRVPGGAAGRLRRGAGGRGRLLLAHLAALLRPRRRQRRGRRPLRPAAGAARRRRGARARARGDLAGGLAGRRARSPTGSGSASAWRARTCRWSRWSAAGSSSAARSRSGSPWRASASARSRSRPPPPR